MFGLLAQPSVVPQQQNAMGSLHNIDFGVFWASWNRFWGSVSGTGSGKPGSGPEALFRVQKVASPRFRRFRCSTCFEGLGSVPEVWTEPVREPGSGNPRY